MPMAGLEPARCYPLDFESSASANSATSAPQTTVVILAYFPAERKHNFLFFQYSLFILSHKARY